ncbi:hypothetical protein FRB90_011031 [Tulasnella sp. 427]|nr:hypothetical protein FRB90_011031 [Tulasnella sp. 427]
MFFSFFVSLLIVSLSCLVDAKGGSAHGVAAHGLSSSSNKVIALLSIILPIVGGIGGGLWGYYRQRQKKKEELAAKQARAVEANGESQHLTASEGAETADSATLVERPDTRTSGWKRFLSRVRRDKPPKALDESNAV